MVLFPGGLISEPLQYICGDEGFNRLYDYFKMYGLQ